MINHMVNRVIYFSLNNQMPFGFSLLVHLVCYDSDKYKAVNVYLLSRDVRVNAREFGSHMDRFFPIILLDHLSGTVKLPVS